MSAQVKEPTYMELVIKALMFVSAIVVGSFYMDDRYVQNVAYTKYENDLKIDISNILIDSRIQNLNNFIDILESKSHKTADDNELILSFKKERDSLYRRKLDDSRLKWR